jgi:hypothetical protein
VVFYFVEQLFKYLSAAFRADTVVVVMVKFLTAAAAYFV